MITEDCNKSLFSNGDCCCNCKFHFEDFYNCCTPYPKELPEPEGCRCSIHKGWICMIIFDNEEPIAHSDWDEHSGCEMHIRKDKI